MFFFSFFGTEKIRSEELIRIPSRIYSIYSTTEKRRLECFGFLAFLERNGKPRIISVGENGNVDAIVSLNNTRSNSEEFPKL